MYRRKHDDYFATLKNVVAKQARQENGELEVNTLTEGIVDTSNVEAKYKEVMPTVDAGPAGNILQKTAQQIQNGNGDVINISKNVDEKIQKMLREHYKASGSFDVLTMEDLQELHEGSVNKDIENMSHIAAGNGKGSFEKIKSTDSKNVTPKPEQTSDALTRAIESDVNDMNSSTDNGGIDYIYSENVDYDEADIDLLGSEMVMESKMEEDMEDVDLLSAEMALDESIEEVDDGFDLELLESVVENTQVDEIMLDTAIEEDAMNINESNIDLSGLIDESIIDDIDLTEGLDVEVESTDPELDALDESLNEYERSVLSLIENDSNFELDEIATSVQDYEL